MKEEKIKLEEPILDDDYPVYWDYLYVADGKVIRSDVQGTVFDLKRDLRNYHKIDAKEIRRCDILGRKKIIKQNEK